MGHWARLKRRYASDIRLLESRYSFLCPRTVVCQLCNTAALDSTSLQIHYAASSSARGRYDAPRSIYRSRLLRTCMLHRCPPAEALFAREHQAKAHLQQKTGFRSLQCPAEVRSQRPYLVAFAGRARRVDNARIHQSTQNTHDSPHKLCCIHPNSAAAP